MNDGYEVLKDNGELYAIKNTGMWHTRFIGKFKDYKSTGRLLSSIPNHIKSLFYDIQRDMKRIDGRRFNNKKFANTIREMQDTIKELEAEIIIHEDDSVTLKLFSQYAEVGQYPYESSGHAIEDIELTNDISNLTINYTE